MKSDILIEVNFLKIIDNAVIKDKYGLHCSWIELVKKRIKNLYTKDVQHV